MTAQRGRAALLVAVSALSVVLAACTTEADPGPPEPSASPTPSPSSASPSPGEPVELTFGISGDRVLREGFEKVARVYTNQHPEVTFDIVPLRGGDDLVDEVTEDPPDVFVATNEEVPGLVADELVQPVDQLLVDRGVMFGDNFQRLGLEAMSADQALHCMPYDVSPLVVFYNPGLVPFRRLTEPGDRPLSVDSGWSWEQFAQAARLMSRQGVKGAYIEPTLDTLMALTRSAGADLVDDPRDATTLTFADGDTRSALEEILAVVRDPAITPTVKQLERVDAVRRFAREDLGMMISTRAIVPELRKRAGFDFDVFPLPRVGSRVRSVADVGGYCLSSTTEHTEAAADFLTFASGERGATIMAQTGEVVPAHVPTLNSLAFTQPGEAPASVVVFDETVERSSVVPFSPHWPELRLAVEPDIRRMFDDVVIDLDEILPRIDEQSVPILSPEETEEAG